MLYAVRGDADTASRGRAPEIAWEDWYLLDEEDMGQAPDHAIIIQAFLDALTVLVSQRRWTEAFVGTDAFFAWLPEHPLVRVSPDVYLLAATPAKPFPRQWELWRGHAPPRFALEVVSQDRVNECTVNPEKYAALGAAELVIYDPALVGHTVRGTKVLKLQRYTRGADGAFELAEESDDVVFSATLDAFLVVDRSVAPPLLRLCHTPDLKSRFPSSAEWAEQERTTRIEAEGELARLREELARLRGP